MLPKIVSWIIDLMAKGINRIFFFHKEANSAVAIILRNFTRNPDFRVTLVEEIAYQKINPTSTSLSKDELIAIFSIWLTQKPLPDVLSLASMYDGNQWSKVLDNNFFEKLSNTATTWRYKGLPLIGDDLLKVGKYMAEMTRNLHYIKEFESQIFHRQQEKDKDYLKPVI